MRHVVIESAIGITMLALALLVRDDLRIDVERLREVGAHARGGLRRFCFGNGRSIETSMAASFCKLLEGSRGGRPTHGQKGAAPPMHAHDARPGCHLNEAASGSASASATASAYDTACLALLELPGVDRSSVDPNDFVHGANRQSYRQLRTVARLEDEFPRRTDLGHRRRPLILHNFTRWHTRQTELAHRVRGCRGSGIFPLAASRTVMAAPEYCRVRRVDHRARNLGQAVEGFSDRVQCR